MESTADLSTARVARPTLAPKPDFQAVSVWLLGFGLVVYLGLNGGGFEPILRSQLGIAVWWGVLLGLAVGALPLNRLGEGSWVAFGLFLAFVCWVALSCIWTDATHNTVTEVSRVLTYLGVFALALSIRAPRGARRMVSALAAAIVVIALVALLSRLHPAWFPGARETANFFPGVRNRLSYPLGYWNGVASLIAIGVPLILYVACFARNIVAQALAAAALPAMGLTVYLTFSRGGVLATLVALAIFFALVRDRLPKAVTVLSAGVGSAILIVATHQRGALADGLSSSLAHQQGNEILAMLLVVCAGVGFIQAGLALALRHGRRPAWTMPSRRTSVVTLVSAAVVLAVAALALGAPGKASDAWQEFKASKSTVSSAARFESFSSNNRWPVWRSALEQNESAPVIGTGSNTFEGWWAQHKGAKKGFVQNAHSLYLETLGGLGIVGLVILLAFLAWVFVSGGRRCLQAARQRRAQLAAALAGCAAFCLGATYDWLWQIAVIPIAFLLLASVLVSAGEQRRAKSLPLAVRLGGVVMAVGAMVAITVPLSSAQALRGSQDAFADGNYAKALSEAADARRAEPFAAAPRVQEALVLEAEGSPAAGVVPAREATRVEPKEWRAWVVRSRLEAESGHARAALDAYREARALNPDSPLFGS